MDLPQSVTSNNGTSVSLEVDCPHISMLTYLLQEGGYDTVTPLSGTCYSELCTLVGVAGLPGVAAFTRSSYPYYAYVVFQDPASEHGLQLVGGAFHIMDPDSGAFSVS